MTVFDCLKQWINDTDNDKKIAYKIDYGNSGDIQADVTADTDTHTEIEQIEFIIYGMWVPSNFSPIAKISLFLSSSFLTVDWQI